MAPAPSTTTFMGCSTDGFASLARFAGVGSWRAAQDEARRARLGDALAVLIGHIALHVSHCFPLIGHPRLRAQQRIPDRAEEVDVERYGGERLVGGERG